MLSFRDSDGESENEIELWQEGKAFEGVLPGRMHSIAIGTVRLDDVVLLPSSSLPKAKTNQAGGTHKPSVSHVKKENSQGHYIYHPSIGIFWEDE